MGSCTAGGAYVPAMSDQTIIVKNQGTIFLGGPPLVKAATGEVVSAEDLGGGDVHTRLSGVADHLAENDDRHALVAGAAASSARLNWHQGSRHGRSCRRAEEPLEADPRPNCYGIIPLDAEGKPARKPFDVREVIARIVDGSRVRGVQGALRHDAGVLASRGSTGMPVGIVANNGILFSRERPTRARTSSSCAAERQACRSLFLQNITGFMVGKQGTRTKASRAPAPRW